MAEGTFEYECMRAELLGVEKPNREEFEEKMKLQREAEEEALLTEQMKEIDDRDEELKGTFGKIDELNKILSSAQQKINKFKNSCGSFSTSIKSRVRTLSGGSSSSEPISEPTSEPEPKLDHITHTIHDAVHTLDIANDAEIVSD